MIEKKKYICLKCRFQFRLGDNRNLICPNCGSDSSMIEEVIENNNAQDIVNKSDQW